MFSSKSFIVSGLTFTSLIHFEFIFVYGVRKCSHFILLHVAVQFSQHPLLKRLSLPHYIFLPHLSETRHPCTVLCLVSQSCLTLCDPMDCSPPGSLSMGILLARILEWVAMASSRGSCQPRDQTQVSHIVSRFFTVWATREALSSVSSIAQLRLTLRYPMDCNMLGFTVHHQLPDFAKTHVHPDSDAIQPSHPLSSHSPPAFNLFQYQGLLQWVSLSHQVAKVLEFQL